MNSGAVNLMFVEEAIPKFCGTDKTYSVTRWAQEIEDNTEIFGLTSTQQLLIARRSLTGTAATWLRSEKPFKTYDDLKTALTREFPDTTNTKEIHELMASRKKRKDEKCYDYMLDMKAIGKKGKLADYVAIQYIIEGIVDSESNKIMLYGVKTYSELKEKLQLYEAFKEKSRNNYAANRRQEERNRNATPRRGPSVRCFNCGEWDHTSSACPHRSKGLKCFRCNSYGHIAAQCNSNDVNISASAKVKRPAGGADDGGNRSHLRDGREMSAKQYCVSTNGGAGAIVYDGMTATMTDDRKMASGTQNCVDVNNNLKTLVIQGLTFKSLVDSGSDVNLITCKVFFTLGITKFTQENVMFTGLGKKQVRQEVDDLVNSYVPVQSKEAPIEMKIILKDDIPVAQRPRRLSVMETKEVDNQIGEWLNDGVIRPSFSEYASPLVLVKKKDGGVRVCVDYRKINSKIVKDEFPLPVIEDHIDKLAHT
ncbi:uncharacterized protein LOC114357021, partial [Ostrinia furnacalis]|uniref:uncharacterized protein LOC114357021 n=1 Tax=Ostrinia furnacalis TaxID=93504 RepID=UPI00103A0733